MQEAQEIPGLGKSPGEENGNPLQYSCLGNPMDRGAWWAIFHGVGQQQQRGTSQPSGISVSWIQSANANRTW